MIIKDIKNTHMLLNNRHWISDVFAGAGIGIGTAAHAYFLNDGY